VAQPANTITMLNHSETDTFTRLVVLFLTANGTGGHSTSRSG